MYWATALCSGWSTGVPTPWAPQAVADDGKNLYQNVDFLGVGILEELYTWIPKYTEMKGWAMVAKDGIRRRIIGTRL